jgi:hypothetical protein
MSRDSKLVFIYAVIVAAMTLLYVRYEDIGLINHAKATPAAAQVAADDE